MVPWAAGRCERGVVASQWHIWCSRKLPEEDPAEDHDKSSTCTREVSILRRDFVQQHVLFSVHDCWSVNLPNHVRTSPAFPKSLTPSKSNWVNGMMRSFIVCWFTVSSAAHSLPISPTDELDTVLRLLMHSLTFDFRVSTVSAHPQKASPIFPRRLSDFSRKWRDASTFWNSMQKDPAYLMPSDRKEEAFQCNVWRGSHHFGWKPSTKRRLEGFLPINTLDSKLYWWSHNASHVHRVGFPLYLLSNVLLITQVMTADETIFLHGIAPKENFGQSPVAFQPISPLRPALPISSPDSVLPYNTKSTHP